MFCWLCISIYACNETNLMHCLSLVYSVTIPLYVSGLLVAHHQEVTMYTCGNQYVLYWEEDCWKLLVYLYIIIKCDTYSCYLNLLKGIGKIIMFNKLHVSQFIMTFRYSSNVQQVWYSCDRASYIREGSEPTRCNKEFYSVVLAQHVSGINMPIIRSTI
jgi:hypothetical protein